MRPYQSVQDIYKLERVTAAENMVEGISMDGDGTGGNGCIIREYEVYAKRNTESLEFPKKKRNGRKRQKQQGLSSSNAFPFPAVLLYIHRLRRDLDDIDILILRLDLTEISRAPCSSFSEI